MFRQGEVTRLQTGHGSTNLSLSECSVLLSPHCEVCMWDLCVPTVTHFIPVSSDAVYRPGVSRPCSDWVEPASSLLRLCLFSYPDVSNHRSCRLNTGLFGFSGNEHRLQTVESVNVEKMTGPILQGLILHLILHHRCFSHTHALMTRTCLGTMTTHAAEQHTHCFCFSLSHSC